MRAALTGGAYSARSVIAGAQKCLNLYVEDVPQGEGEAASAIHYPTPGLSLLSVAPQSGCRGTYRAKSGDLYVVYGRGVYAISASWAFTLIGSVNAGASRVSMADNGVIMFIVDGSASGWVYTFGGAYQTMADEGFYGADTVDYFLTYFVFNKPGFPTFYVSDSNASTFDATFFANFSGYQDPMVAAVQSHGTLALIGQTHTEWWAGGVATDPITGFVTFPFQDVPTAIVEHGTCAKYSIARADAALFWLSQNEQGQGIGVIARGYQTSRISTHAIETEWQTYPRIDDAWGYTRQQGGHLFWVLSFPSADRTWVYDLASEKWHEWGAYDGATQHRHRGQCGVFAREKFVVGDFENGNLYALDPAAYTDNGTRVRRVRSFPHMTRDGRRVIYPMFIADMECGTTTGEEPIVTLEWSDDRGATYTGLQTDTLGVAGATLTSVQFQRLGMARDRVFKLSWDAPVATALIGAWIDTRPCGS